MQPVFHSQHVAVQALHKHCADIVLVFARDGRPIRRTWPSIATIFGLTGYVSLDAPSRAHTNDEPSADVAHQVAKVAGMANKLSATGPDLGLNARSVLH